MIRLLVSIAATLTLLLAGCSDDDDDSVTGENNSAPTATRAAGESAGSGQDGGNAEFHACSLFTGAELGAVLGVEMNDGRDYLATAPGATNCTWKGGANVFVEVLLEDGEDWYDAIHIPGAAVGEVEEIDGVGDIATWDEFLGTLDVVEGDRFVSVQPLVGFTGLNKQQVAIQIAQLALERLP